VWDDDKSTSDNNKNHAAQSADYIRMIGAYLSCSASRPVAVFFRNNPGIYKKKSRNFKRDICMYFKNNIGPFEGNSSDWLTIFLDSILTKYFCKRGVNGC
jgi:hypothetical protein